MLGKGIYSESKCSSHLEHPSFAIVLGNLFIWCAVQAKPSVKGIQVADLLSVCWSACTGRAVVILLIPLQHAHLIQLQQILVCTPRYSCETESCAHCTHFWPLFIQYSCIWDQAFGVSQVGDKDRNNPWVLLHPENPLCCSGCARLNTRESQNYLHSVFEYIQQSLEMAHSTQRW